MTVESFHGSAITAPGYFGGFSKGHSFQGVFQELLGVPGVSGHPGNEFAQNVIVCSGDNSSSRYSENHKNIFLILSKGKADGINGINSVGEPEKVLY